MTAQDDSRTSIVYRRASARARIRAVAVALILTVLPVHSWSMAAVIVSSKLLRSSGNVCWGTHSTKSRCTSHTLGITTSRDDFMESDETASTPSSFLNDSTVLLQGQHGTLYQVALEQSSTPSTLRPGEDERHFERAVTLGDDIIPESSILCLHRFKIWWMKPVWVSSLQHVPPESILVLYQSQRTHHYHVVLAVAMPLSDSTFATSSLRGSRSDESLVLCSNGAHTALYVGTHATDPYALMHDAVLVAARQWQPTVVSPVSRVHDTKLPRGRLGPATATGHLLQSTLGWCTWNAFYTRVTGLGVVEAVRALQVTHQVPIQWMILDDGWQETCSSGPVHDHDTQVADGNQWARRLESLTEDPDKFAPPWTLQTTIGQLRRSSRNSDTGPTTSRDMYTDQNWGVNAILVWHTLAGYWLGIQVPSIDHTTVASDTNKWTKSKSLPTGHLSYPRFPRGILHHDPTASNEASVTRGVGIPDDAHDFYRRYYDYLVHCGVDGVKVDAQAVTGILCRPERNTDELTDTPTGDTTTQTVEQKPLQESSPSLALHSALADSVRSNFVSCSNEDALDDGVPTDASDDNLTRQPSPRNAPAPVIHCMAHSPEILYRLPALYNGTATSHGDNNPTWIRPFVRAADDYYPDNPASHGAQIVACAYNSLLLGQLAIPDWDMFTTTLADDSLVRMHAIAKCLSGGPIYLSDAPVSDIVSTPPNRTVLEWICCQDGTTFPCRAAALPTRGSLLSDPLTSSTVATSPLVIWNTNGDASHMTNGVVGIFCLQGSGQWNSSVLNYCADEQGIAEKTYALAFQPLDIAPLSDDKFHATQFLVIGFFTNVVRVLRQDEVLHLQLDPLKSESLAVYPICQVSAGVDFVALGVRGRINGAGAIQRLDCLSDNAGVSIHLHVRGCGILDLAMRTTPPNVPSSRVSIRVNGIVVPLESIVESSPKHERLRALGWNILSVRLSPCHPLSAHDVVVDT